VILAFAALLSFDDLSRALLVPATFAVLTSLEGFFLTPSVLGRRLTLSPVAVFTSLLVWSWLWGVVGALIAVPTLAVSKIVCDQVDSLKPIGTLIGR
jgi:predicted PurR-regulated permease PerM